MKIIRRGIPKKEVVWEGTCTDCNSVIEAKRSEVAMEYDPVGRDDFGRANCPVCGHGMVFYPKKESRVRSDHE